MLFPVSVKAHTDNIDTHMAFHNPIHNVEILDQFHLRRGEIQIEVFITDQTEPYLNPFALRVFIKKGDNTYKQLNRKINGREEKTYCLIGEPEIARGHELNLERGEYFVIPVSEFDDAHGVCPNEAQHLEVYPMTDLDPSLRSG